MNILGKISLPSLLLTIILTLFGIAILSTFIWYVNHAFALEQNSLLLQQQRNDNSNITKKFTLIADENVFRI